MASAHAVYCDHGGLDFEPSSHASEAGYRRNKTTPQTLSSTFPAPLVLPGDDLSLDPKQSAQSLESWKREKDRNEVTNERNIIYVVQPPTILPDARLAASWSIPNPRSRSKRKHAKRQRTETDAPNTSTPPIDDIAEYVTAFYRPLPVKTLPVDTLAFTTWDDENAEALQSLAARSEPALIGLSTPTGCVGIRARPCPDRSFKAQLHLDDLLDAAIGMLPDDAYALILVMEQDMYESDEDVFQCGRAYGGSRVAVVSMARYNPCMDELHGVNRLHSWPASHCAEYMESCCSMAKSTRPPLQRSLASKGNIGQNSHALSPDVSVTPSPMVAAVSAYAAAEQAVNTSRTTATALWLGRICRTAVHELGHCFGIDHCVSYACIMQGSASLAEDVRQPLYLCPLDLKKLLRATGLSEEEHCRSLLQICKKHDEAQPFCAFAAWIAARLEQLEKATESLRKN